MKRSVHSFDAWASLAIHRLPQWLYRPFVILCIALSPLTWFAVVGAATAYAALIDERALALAGALTIVLLPLSEVSKLVARRNRPTTDYVKAMRRRTYSFPSSHTYGAVLAGGYLALFLMDVFWGMLVLPLAVIVTAIGIARIYLGAHYPSDVLAGALLAVIVLMGTIYTTNRLVGGIGL